MLQGSGGFYELIRTIFVLTRGEIVLGRVPISVRPVGELAMDETPRFGSLLKRYRRAAHQTQESLAVRAGYSSHYVSMLERGVRPPHPMTVDTLADALALSDPERVALHAAALGESSRLADANHAHLLPSSPQLIGREGETAHMVRLLQRDDVRLLTLTGPGGVGKTSLARWTSALVAPTFTDGVAFIDFSAVAATDDVITVISRGLALREMRGRLIQDRLTAFLRDRKQLLLLDCFERVVERATAIADLLNACPQITCLVTSRIPLRLRIEHEFRVRPLTIPQPGDAHDADDLVQYPAVSLFVQQARMVKPEFAIDASTTAPVADICRRLDGLPLAIELAAARVAHLPVVTLRDRLEHRLRVLTGGPRDLPERQQCMRDTIAWSYDLLPDQYRMLFRRLAVFTGSWTLAAAEDIWGDDEDASFIEVLDGVRELVDNSLVVPVDDATDEPRYRMLDTIREYATEQLAAAGEAASVQRRHALYYVQRAEQAEPALQDGQQRDWYPHLEREQDNFRAALAWLLQAGEIELALRLAGAIWRFWQRHGDIREGRRWLEEGLSHGAEISDQVRAKALWGASWLAYYFGDYALGSTFSSEYLELARRLDDAISLRNALTCMGIGALAEERYSEALAALQEALDVCVPLGKTWHRATSLMNLGAATLVIGDLAQASALFEEALALYQERGDEVFATRARQHIGYVFLRRGDYMDAGVIFAQTLQAFYRFGEQGGLADGLEAVAATCAAIGKRRQATLLIGAADTLREHIGVAPLPHIRAVWQPYIAQAEELFGKSAWSEIQAQGRLLSLSDAVALALSSAASTGATNQV